MSQEVNNKCGKVWPGCSSWDDGKVIDEAKKRKVKQCEFKEAEVQVEIN